MVIKIYLNSLDKPQIHSVEVKLQDYHDDKSSEICTRNLRMTPRPPQNDLVPSRSWWKKNYFIDGNNKYQKRKFEIF